MRCYGDASLVRLCCATALDCDMDFRRFGIPLGYETGTSLNTVA
jgi:hypothetical protein